MPLILKEDEGKVLGKRQIKVPDKIVDKLKLNRNLFAGYPKAKGYKRINSIVDDDYNKRSNKKDKIHNGDKTVSFSDLKRIDFDLRHTSPNPYNLDYVLQAPLKQWANDELKKLRTSVKKVNAVPPVPKIEKKPLTVPKAQKDLKMGNATVRLTEGLDYFYEEYYFDYGATYVFNSFLENPKGKQNWGVLINPEMYAKALREFTRFGKLTNFPSKYVYQWMGIIMKNTSILIANTEICGHGQNFPTEECEEFLKKYFNDGRDISVYDYDKVVIEITPEEVVKMGKEGYLIKEVADKYGQTYFPWITQKDADRMAVEYNNRIAKEKFKEIYGDLTKYIDSYNEKHKSEYRNDELNIEAGKIYWTVGSDEILYQIGITDQWMQLPDGSNAISDYGINPIISILKEFDENLPPEKVLVLVNKALDVYHCRGDLSSMFVQGGSKALSAIAEEIKRDKKIIVSESQLLLLKEYHGQQVFNFDDNGEPYYKKNNYENYIDYLESIGHYGQLPPSEWNEHTISQTIDRELENIYPGRDDLNEDDYNYAFYDLITNSFFCYNNSDEIFNENFIEIMDRYEKFLEQYNYINSSGNLEYFLRSKENLYINDEEDASIYLTDLGEEEYEKELNDAYRSHIDEYDLKNGLTINERGLIYMEREIVIPKANSPYMKSNYKGSFDNDYYKSLTDNYYGIGNCFTWQKGASEAYCANSFSIGNTYVTLKCWIDPKDVNWEETVQRNCYGLREEQEIYVNDGGAKIEVFDVVVGRAEFGDRTVSNAHILRKPIIVNP